MSDKCKTLFVFEGPDTEKKIVSKMERNFIGDSFSVKCAYCGDIYQFYNNLKAEDFATDILSLLKERNSKNRAALAGYDADSFAYTYFFFDYDGHATKADDDQIAELLDFFNNETENGKMFISYPMVEAIKHFKDKESFRELTAKCKRRNCPNFQSCSIQEKYIDEPHYKNIAATDCDREIAKLDTIDKWKMIINVHLCKGNYIINGDFSLPDKLLEQSVLFACQRATYISQHCPVVAVLSAFPFFLQEYYGASALNEKLK